MHMEIEKGDEGMMARPQYLEEPTSIIFIIERSQLKKIDNVAGLGNRSSYVRWLIDTIDEKSVKKWIALEIENKILKRTSAVFEGELKEKNQKIAMLKRVIKALREGKPRDLNDYPGIDKIIEEYKLWKTQLEARGIIIKMGRELDWVKLRAKEIDVKPNELITYLHQHTLK